MFSGLDTIEVIFDKYYYTKVFDKDSSFHNTIRKFYDLFTKTFDESNEYITFQIPAELKDEFDSVINSILKKYGENYGYAVFPVTKDQLMTIVSQIDDPSVFNTYIEWSKYIDIPVQIDMEKVYFLIPAQKFYNFLNEFKKLTEKRYELERDIALRLKEYLIKNMYVESGVPLRELKRGVTYRVAVKNVLKEEKEWWKNPIFISALVLLGFITFVSLRE